jgi:hypothetical protein
MLEEENNTKDLRFYSQKAILITTFITGPLAACYFIRENYLSLNKPQEANRSLVIGIIGCIILFSTLAIIPESILDRVPNQIYPLFYTGILYLIIEKIHGPILKQHKEFGNQFHTGWKVALIGFVSATVTIVVIFGVAFMLPAGIEYERYDTKMETFYINEGETILFYDHLETNSIPALLYELDNEVIPKWRENIKIVESINNIENLPPELLEINSNIHEYSELRLKTFKLYRKALNEDTDKYDAELDEMNTRIDQIIDESNE